MLFAGNGGVPVAALKLIRHAWDAFPAKPTSSGSDFDFPRAIFPTLWNTYCQDAILQLGIDGIGLQFPAQHETARVVRGLHVRVDRFHAFWHLDCRVTFDREAVPVRMHIQAVSRRA